MGTTLSVIILLTGSIGTGILSSIGANYAREEQWNYAMGFTSAALVLALALVFLVTMIVVGSHQGAGMFASILEEAAIGIMLAFILMLISFIGVSLLQIFTLMAEYNQDNVKATVLAGVSAALSFISFIAALIIIIFLL